MTNRRKIVAVVTDGIGIAPIGMGNAVTSAQTPKNDRRWGMDPSISVYRNEESLSVKLSAHGPDVGLPPGVMGNSEVGHSTLFSGCAYDETATTLTNQLSDKSLYLNPVWNQLTAAGKNDGTLHFLGLLSDGQVHSDIAHLVAMVRQAAEDGVKKLRVWALTDGRDVGPSSAQDYIAIVENVFSELGDLDYQISMIAGRGTTLMDRGESNWKIVEQAWNALFGGNAVVCKSTGEALAELRTEAKKTFGEFTDENLGVRLLEEPDGSTPGVKEGDSLFLFNYRTDRIAQFISWMLDCPLTEAAIEQEVQRINKPDGIHFTVVCNFDPDNLPVSNYFYEAIKFEDTLVDFLGSHDCRVFAISEPSKFPHVTSFTNRRSSTVPAHCEWFKVPSTQEAPFRDKPEMSMPQIASKTAEVVKSQEFDLIIVNLPAPDMVGHEANLDAAIAAVEATEVALEEIIRAARSVGASVIYGGDHGNAECMYAIKNGELVYEDRKLVSHTAHTTNPVRWTLVCPTDKECAQVHIVKILNPSIANISATIAVLMGLEEDHPPHWKPSLFRVDK